VIGINFGSFFLDMTLLTFIGLADPSGTTDADKIVENLISQVRASS
jgi:hypothetical protein